MNIEDGYYWARETTDSIYQAEVIQVVTWLTKSIIGVDTMRCVYFFHKDPMSLEEFNEKYVITGDVLNMSLPENNDE